MLLACVLFLLKTKKMKSRKKNNKKLYINYKNI